MTIQGVGDSNVQVTHRQHTVWVKTHSQRTPCIKLYLYFLLPIIQIILSCLDCFTGETKGERVLPRVTDSRVLCLPMQRRKVIFVTKRQRPGINFSGRFFTSFLLHLCEFCCYQLQSDEPRLWRFVKRNCSVFMRHFQCLSHYWNNFDLLYVISIIWATKSAINAHKAML